MTALEVLVAAKAKITLPGSWTQEASARDVNGAVVSPVCSAAICWCSLGALESAVLSATSPNKLYAYEKAVKVLQAFSTDQSVIAMNDSSTQAEVLQCFDKAIESLTKEPS